MQLKTFDLESYIDIDNSHSSVINKLEEDKDATVFLGNLTSYINRILRRKEDEILYNDVYIAYYKKEPIGFISITHYNDIYEVASGIIKEERGKQLGAKLLEEFTQKTFETLPKIDKLTLIIKKENTKAIKTAISVGYTLENKSVEGNHYSKNRYSFEDKGAEGYRNSQKRR